MVLPIVDLSVFVLRFDKANPPVPTTISAQAEFKLNIADMCQ